MKRKQLKRKLKEKRDFEEKTVHKSIRYIYLLEFQMMQEIESYSASNICPKQNPWKGTQFNSIDIYKSTNYLYCKPCCYFVIQRIVQAHHDAKS